MSPQSFFQLRRLLAAGALMAGLAPVPALADSASANITNLLTTQISVNSNGSSYTSVAGLATLTADVRIQVDAEVSGRVKSWRVWLGLSDGEGNHLQFQTMGVGKSYGTFERPRRVDRTERVIVHAVAWQGFVAARCNELADELRSGGLPDSAIFAQDRTLQLGVTAHFDADISGVGGYFVGAKPWEEIPKTQVICKKWQGSAIPQAGTGLSVAPTKVVNKGLSIYEQYGITGVCKIRLDGWITTDKKNTTVKFRYRNQAGKLSKVWTVNTGQSKTATFSHWYDIQNTEWAETGFVRMVGVSHDFRSDWAEYTMECVEGGPGGLVANLPPEVSLQAIPQGEVMVHGRICPESVKLVAVLEGRGNVSGEMVFFGTAFFAKKYDYSIKPGQQVLRGQDAELRWNNVPAPAHANLPLTQSRQFGLKVTDQTGKVIASVPQHAFLFGCSAPSVNPAVQPGPGGLTVEPRNPNAGTSAAPRQLRVLPQPPAPPPTPLQLLRPKSD